MGNGFAFTRNSAAIYGLGIWWYIILILNILLKKKMGLKISSG